MDVRQLTISALVLVCLVAVGCTDPNLPDLGTVSGTVTLDGEPLPGALVTFQPQGAGRPSYARTDESGEYELVFNRDAEGAMVGTHSVEISTYVAGDVDAGTETVPEKVPAQYNAETTLTEEVVAGSQTIDFELSSEGEIIVEEESAAMEAEAASKE